MISVKKIALCSIGVMLLSTTAFAKQQDNDYDANYYTDEGRINFKIRGLGSITGTKVPAMPPPTSIRGIAAPQKNHRLMADGMGIEGVTDLFFGDNVAAEFGLGLVLYKTSLSALKAAAYNYSNTADVAKKKNIYAIPATLTLQYHIAPFGAIRPYVGGGYSGTYFVSKAQQLKVSNAHGKVFQAGVDFVMTDDALINLDIKKYSLAPKVTYKRSIIDSGVTVAPKVKMNPTVISIGVGVKL